MSTVTTASQSLICQWNVNVNPIAETSLSRGSEVFNVDTLSSRCINPSELDYKHKAVYHLGRTI